MGEFGAETKQAVARGEGGKGTAGEKTLLKLPQSSLDAPIRDFAISLVGQQTMRSDGQMSQGQASNGTGLDLAQRAKIQLRSCLS